MAFDLGTEGNPSYAPEFCTACCAATSIASVSNVRLISESKASVLLNQCFFTRSENQKRKIASGPLTLKSHRSVKNAFENIYINRRKFACIRISIKERFRNIGRIKSCFDQIRLLKFKCTGRVAIFRQT